jgi:hypothetical protein
MNRSIEARGRRRGSVVRRAFVRFVPALITVSFASLVALVPAGAAGADARSSSPPGPPPTCPPNGNHYIGIARTADGHGYWLVRSKGQVRSYGDAPINASQLLPKAPIVSIAAVPGTSGYLLLGQDGTVVAEGATSFGSATGVGSACDAVSIAATADGGGYWILLTTGTVIPLGDAVSYGDASGSSGTTFVGITPSPDGKGYLLLGSNGLVDPFGDAVAYCNPYQINPNGFSVAGLAFTADGGGFWIVGSPPKNNGGVFACGDADYLGSPNPVPSAPFDGVAAAPIGMGYWLLDNRGKVFPFGNASRYPFVGSN